MPIDVFFWLLNETLSVAISCGERKKEESATEVPKSQCLFCEVVKNNGRNESSLDVRKSKSKFCACFQSLK